MSDLPKARRTDGTVYTPTNPMNKGCGFRRMCCKCGQAKAIKPGWKKHGLGMRCPECSGRAA